MSIYACIRRQQWSELYYQIDSTYDHSLITCRECNQGRQVKTNLDFTLDQDFHSLKENQLKTIKNRGWVFKESIALETLLDDYDYTKMKEGNNNGERGKITNGTGKINENSKTDGRIRIAGFVTKHRINAGTKQNILKPFRIKTNIK